jgi:hypothetical protein
VHVALPETYTGGLLGWRGQPLVLLRTAFRDCTATGRRGAAPRHCAAALCRGTALCRGAAPRGGAAPRPPVLLCTAYRAPPRPAKSHFCGPNFEPRLDSCSKARKESGSGLHSLPRETHNFRLFASRWCCWWTFCNGVICSSQFGRNSWIPPGTILGARLPKLLAVVWLLGQADPSHCAQLARK